MNKFSEAFDKVPEVLAPVGNAVKDGYSSYGAQTGNYFSRVFGDTPIPYMTGKEIASWWENQMSQSGKDRYNRQDGGGTLYREATDPLNVLSTLSGINTVGKAVKGIDLVADPVSGAVVEFIKAYGKVMNNNAKQKGMARARIR